MSILKKIEDYFNSPAEDCNLDDNNGIHIRKYEPNKEFVKEIADFILLGPNYQRENEII